MGATYEQIESAFPTVDAFETALPTYPDVRAWMPGSGTPIASGARTRSGHANGAFVVDSRVRSGSARALVGDSFRVRSGFARPLTGRALRTRAGTVDFLLVASMGTGARNRQGDAIFGQRTDSSGEADRSRGGYSFVIISNIGTGTASTVNPWRLDDPLTGASYVFEINGNDGGTPARQRTFTIVPTTASDGVALTFEGQEQVATLSFKGTLRTVTQYRSFSSWFQKRYPVLLTDDLGRQMQVTLEKWEPVRASRIRTPYRFTYTATYKVLAGGMA